MRTTIAASAAAVGAVATGAFTALIPTPGDGNTTTAAADETAGAGTIRIPAHARAVGALAPVVYAEDRTDQPVGFAAADQHLAMLGKATDIATKIAAQHAAEQQRQAEQIRIDAVVSTGGVDGWIAEALRVLDLPQSVAPSVRRIVMSESGGNPFAINNWDANARRGTPSQGLMQTIPSTFRHYVAPQLAHRPITDPVANLTAGLRYMIDNYGLTTVEAGGRTNSYGGYVGY